MKTTFTYLRSSIVCVTFLFLSFNAMAEDDFSGLFCPDDVYVDCNDEIWDLSIYGNAYYKDYGGSHDAGYPVVQYYLNSCDIGYITRTWSVIIYGTPYSCTQTIHVSGDGGVGYGDINWPPKHVDLTGCSPETDPYTMPDGYPTWGYGDCNLLAMSYRDTYFTISGTCNKIIREWTVLDWCIYDPYHNPNVGKYRYFQTIKIADEAIPEFTCPGDIEINSYNCKNAAIEADPLIIDPSTCGGNFTITNNSPYADEGKNDISGVYPIGTTEVKYSIKYGCGKVETCTINVKVKDSKAPTPYCYAYMAISLMGIDNDGDGVNDEGMAEVWAKDLDAGSFAHCVGGPLSFSFSADTSDNVRMYSCDQVGENTEQMWVTDGQGNQSWCVVILDVQNNSANIQDCQRLDDSAEEENPDEATEMFTFEGTVSSNYGKMISDVEITLIDMAGEMTITTRKDTSTITTYDTIINVDGSKLIRHLEETFIEEIIDTNVQYMPELKYTDDQGRYSFHEMASALSTYKLQATPAVEDYSNIDLDDIEVLFNHLTRQSSFTSPYEYIAADVDGDGRISFMDLRIMLMYYTGNINTFPIGVSSVIVDAKATFEEPSLAISGECPDYIVVNEVSGDEKGLDFIQIYIGDLHQSENARNKVNIRSHNMASEILGEFNNKKFIEKVGQLIRNPEESNLGIYPNPFNDEVNIVLTSISNQSPNFEVYGLDGKLLSSKRLTVQTGLNHMRINMEELNDGIYIYRINVGDTLYSGKLVKR